mmetsp:Transcript_99730/g.307653  ORF Transcript_99730/g.307653 Transcript_99730/m.307653 type:complete len:255 (-) Transcript_99730:943-1707(-)
MQAQLRSQLAQVRRGIPALPAGRRQNNAVAVTADQEGTLDPGVVAALDGGELLRRDELVELREVDKRSSPPAASGQLEENSEVLLRAALTPSFGHGIDEGVAHLVLVLVHDLHFRARPAAREHMRDGAVADATEVQKAALHLARVVPPVEGIVDLKVWMRQDVQLPEGLGNDVVAEAVAGGPLLRLLHDLLLERGREDALWEEPRAILHELLGKVQHAAGQRLRRGRRRRADMRPEGLLAVLRDPALDEVHARL